MVEKFDIYVYGGKPALGEYFLTYDYYGSWNDSFNRKDESRIGEVIIRKELSSW